MPFGARLGCGSGLRNGYIFQHKLSEEAKSSSKDPNKILPPVLKQRIWFSILMKLVSVKSTCLQRLTPVRRKLGWRFKTANDQLTVVLGAEAVSGYPCPCTYEWWYSFCWGFNEKVTKILSRVPQHCFPPKHHYFQRAIGGCPWSYHMEKCLWNILSSSNSFISLGMNVTSLSPEQKGKLKIALFRRCCSEKCLAKSKGPQHSARGHIHSWLRWLYVLPILWKKDAAGWV